MPPVPLDEPVFGLDLGGGTVPVDCLRAVLTSDRSAGEPRTIEPSILPWLLVGSYDGAACGLMAPSDLMSLYDSVRVVPGVSA